MSKVKIWIYMAYTFKTWTLYNKSNLYYNSCLWNQWARRLELEFWTMNYSGSRITIQGALDFRVSEKSKLDILISGLPLTIIKIGFGTHVLYLCQSDIPQTFGYLENSIVWIIYYIVSLWRLHFFLCSVIYCLHNLNESLPSV